MQLPLVDALRDQDVPMRQAAHDVDMDDVGMGDAKEDAENESEVEQDDVMSDADVGMDTRTPQKVGVRKE